jgi:hypothetical protein
VLEKSLRRVKEKIRAIFLSKNGCFPSAGRLEENLRPAFEGNQEVCSRKGTEESRLNEAQKIALWQGRRLSLHECSESLLFTGER